MLGLDDRAMKKTQLTARNVLGTALKTCSRKPMTGFFRDGCCNTSDEDQGAHTVCVEMTAEFLAFSRQAGNDLSTPHPEFGFPGLEPGCVDCPRVFRCGYARRKGTA